MKNRIENWEKMGLLEITSKERKEFVANVLELLMSYLIHCSKENNDWDERAETYLFPIFTRIANEMDFGINDFYLIIEEVTVGILNWNFDENSEVDEEALFCKEFCDNKIVELKSR